ncbi:RNA 2'-phosphotransferase [Noviherbaspirillum autotrophicum]|uniref:RNA 2'-phosphotransferase n=1 Tax=Noviherbaspirillum autotrophicum TaxID=709839 RepID=UPI001E50DAA5|nr:RNA 2'-phosphotransferase [Noviherbaspirillum autotrophicum]
MNEQLVKKSRFLSRVLRHRPDSIGITLDKQGWTEVSELLEKAASHGMQVSREELDRIVVENDKRRFTFNADRSQIRAAQGHSVKVDLQLPVCTPPPVLYHGTVVKFLPSIRKQGLFPGSRHDVHLSANMETALAVGARRGSPVVISVETYSLLRDGFQFRCADNGVWLISKVPVKYLRFPDV